VRQKSPLEVIGEDKKEFAADAPFSPPWKFDGNAEHVTKAISELDKIKPNAIIILPYL
jgi:hypothetical protein